MGVYGHNGALGTAMNTAFQNAAGGDTAALNQDTQEALDTYAKSQGFKNNQERQAACAQAIQKYGTPK